MTLAPGAWEDHMDAVGSRSIPGEAPIRTDRSGPVAADVSAPAPVDVSTAGPRIHALDTLRGFALCGIVIINIYQQVVFRGAASGTAPQLPTAVQLLFYERFYPIFSILFGIGFGIFLQR